MGYTSDISFRGGLLDSSSSITTSSSFLKPLQAQVDDCVSHFTEQTLDWKALSAMMAGGLAYRFGRIGSLALGTGHLASLGIGLGTEVAAFEMANRSLTALTGEGSQNPNLWRWGGVGGICQGLLSSLITFGSLKGAGRLAQGENVVVQHLLQDTGMVLGHQISGAFDVTGRPTGSLAEQFFHAEAMNLKLGAGMALASRLTPSLTALEKGMDLSLRSLETPPLLPEGDNQAWAMAGTGPSPHSFPQGEKNQNLFKMKSTHEAAERDPSAENFPSIFTEGNPYSMNKRVPDGLPILRVSPKTSDDPVRTILDALEGHLKKRRTSLVIHYEGGMLDSRKQEDLKIRLKSIFEGRLITEGFMLVVAIPNGMPKMALIFEKKGTGMTPSWTQLRMSDSPMRSPSQAKRASIPEDIRTVDQADGVFEILKEVLPTDDPRLCFTGSSWGIRNSMQLAKQLETEGLDRRKTFSLLLKEQAVQVVFRWEREGGQDKVQWATGPIGHDSASSGILPKVPAFSEPLRPRFSEPPLPPPRSKSVAPSPEPSPPPARNVEPPRSPVSLETHNLLAKTQAIMERMANPPPDSPPEVRTPEPIRIPCGEPSLVLDKLRPLLEYQRWKPFILELKTGRLDQEFLPILAQFFKDHPFREGQDVSIAWEGSCHLKIWKENGQMKAELRTTMDDGLITQQFVFRSDKFQQTGYNYSSTKKGRG